MTAKPETSQPIKKYCAYCEKELHGREGKMYCNVDCKNNFNARILAAKRARENKVFPNTIAQLKKNYRILASFGLHEQQPGETIQIHLDKLKKYGFDYRFCTGAYKDHNSPMRNYCFDYQWIKEGSYLTISYAPDLSKLG